MVEFLTNVQIVKTVMDICKGGSGSLLLKRSERPPA